MSAIQIVLTVSALLWLAGYFGKHRSATGARLLAVAAATGGIALVLAPDLSSRLARLLGVARGVDLVIYLAFVVFGFLWLHLLSRLRDLEMKLVALTRAMALGPASGPAETKGREGAPRDPPQDQITG